jgi:hypothetical protein
MNIVRAKRSFSGLGVVIEDPTGNAGFLPSDYTVIDESTGQAVMTDENGNPIPVLNEPTDLVLPGTIQPAGNVVPKPTSSGPTYQFNVTPATSSLTPGLPLGPAPRVAAVPGSVTSLLSSSTAGLPTWMLIVAGGVALALMAAPGGRRR